MMRSRSSSGAARAIGAALLAVVALVACTDDNPAQGTPATTQPAGTDTTDTTDTPDEPAVTDPLPTDPATVETDPVETDPPPTDPAAPELLVSAPVTVDGSALAPFQSSSSDAALGTVAPVLHGSDFEGNQITIDATVDGPYMVVFLAHWCPHCQREVPVLNAWNLSGAVPDDLNVIGVATAVAESATNFPPGQWFSDIGWEWPAMIDESQGDGAAGVAATAYGATGWPYFVIIGSDGTVKARHSGEIAADELQQLVDTALAS